MRTWRRGRTARSRRPATDGGRRWAPVAPGATAGWAGATGFGGLAVAYLLLKGLPMTTSKEISMARISTCAAMAMAMAMALTGCVDDGEGEPDDPAGDLGDEEWADEGPTEEDEASDSGE